MLGRRRKERVDEGAVGGGDREEREEPPIIPDPITVDPSLPTTVRWIQVSYVNVVQ